MQPTAQDPGTGSPYQAIRTAMSMNLGVFKEPRGVMRIIQFVSNVNSYVKKQLDHVPSQEACNRTEPMHLIGDFSSDAQFFVATGVLSFLYCIGIAIVYIMFDAMYQSNGLLPLADFFLTVTLAVFWLSGSAAWANGLNGLKGTTSNLKLTSQCLPDFCTSIVVGSHSELTISVILGFLNFFLWASDLWFLYKETPWFKLKQGTGVNTAA
ncbi:hypothetical protein C0J52_09274 [Blattella germanica]|nr:hypothetical protein C0J52_09274 [Blattella germanica]